MIVGDADGEALDHRPRDVGEVAAQASEGGRDDEHAGQEPDHEHGVGPVAGHDRHEHHGHGTGRARHLHVGPPEDRSDQTRDDRGDQPGVRHRARW